MNKKNKFKEDYNDYCWCPGKRAVEELLLHKNHRIKEIVLTKESSFNDIIEKTNELQIPYRILTKDLFLEIDESFESVNHQWIAAKITQSTSSDYKQIINKILKEEFPLIVVLDQIQDPQNLGAIFRICECAGVSALMFTSNRSANISPLVRKISAGASELLPFSQIQNLAQVISHAKDNGFWVYGTSLTDKSEIIYEAKIHHPCMLIMGSEHKGLRKQTENLCDVLLNIPQYGLLQSMNVSSSTAVAVFEIQRRLRYTKVKNN